MSNLEKMFIGLSGSEGQFVIQEASYIEGGLLIRELLCGGFEIISIPEFGGEESSEGTFLTLKEAWFEYKRMKREYT